MRVVEVNSIDGLPGLRLAWRSLLGETPGANFQQSCEWLEAAHRNQPRNAQLRVLLVTGDGETVGILPLTQTERATRFGSLRVLGYPPDQWSSCQGPIGPQPAATLMAALRYLSSSEQEWDVLEFRHVDRAAADYQRTRTALRVADMHFLENDEAPCHVIDLPNQASDLVAGLSIAGCERVGSSQLTFERHRPRGAMYDDADPGWGLFDRCLELPVDERQRTAASKEFLRDIHAAACRSGAADLNVLRHGSEIVACCYNVQFNGTLLTAFSGSSFDSHASRRAALQSLVSEMLQDSVTRLDQRWLPGAELLNPQWPATPLRRSRLVHYRKGGAHGLIGRLAEWLPAFS